MGVKVRNIKNPKIVRELDDWLANDYIGTKEWELAPKEEKSVDNQMNQASQTKKSAK